MYDHGDKAAAWAVYNAAVLKTSIQTNKSRTFEDRLVHFGNISVGLACDLKNIILEGEHCSFTREDSHPGFVSVLFEQDIVLNMNKTAKMRRFSAHETWLLQDLLEEIKQDVAECLASPWRVLNMKAWTTPPRSEDFGPYAWHSDGFIPEIFKVMIYLVPLSVETGSFEFKVGGEVVRHLCAEPGSWALFQNTDIIHRGVPGTVEERVSVEITITRSAAFDLRYRCAGLNGHWPQYPWIDVVEGSEADWQRLLANKPVISKKRDRTHWSWPYLRLFDKKNNP